MDSIKVKVFFDSTEAKSWHEACKQGDPTKCYILSMRNDNQSTEWKKFACGRQVERACFDLYSEAKKQKRGDNAAEYAEKSCYLGNKAACFHAATILFIGKDMNAKKDLKKSLELFEDSCLAEYSESCNILDKLFRKNVSKEIESNEERDKLYNEMACRLGEEVACNEACKLGLKELCPKNNWRMKR